jgi:hypothetical protein
MPTSQERRVLEERLSEAKKKKKESKVQSVPAGKENKQITKKAQKVRNKPKLQYVYTLFFFLTWSMCG